MTRIQEHHLETNEGFKFLLRYKTLTGQELHPSLTERLEGTFKHWTNQALALALETDNTGKLSLRLGTECHRIQKRLVKDFGLYGHTPILAYATVGWRRQTVEVPS